jgi:hypothetical protein
MDIKQWYVTNYEKLAHDTDKKPPKFGELWDPYPPNIERVMKAVSPGDMVLDVGGWYKPFTRANYVIDINPYETRGAGGSIGGVKEHFDQSTWIQMDICSQRWPFDDKDFDFVYCGEVLEDVRDPLHICREIIRVGKAGYIEVPSIWIECQYGVDGEPLTDLYPGFHKHKWLVEVTDNRLLFIPKLVYLCTLKFVDDEVSNHYRQCHEIWTSMLYWQDEFEYDVVVYPNTLEVIRKLRDYFSNFDYSRFAVP